MSSEPLLTKTMRIDIPLDFRKKPPTPVVGPPRLEANPVVSRRIVRGKSDTQRFLTNTDLRELFQGLYDAAFITDLYGVIIDANSRAEYFFQYSCSEFAGANIEEIIRGLNRDVLKTICSNLENDKFTLIQAWCERKDDSLLSAEVSVSRLTLLGQSILCFFVRDVTARKEDEEALKAAHVELEAEMQERVRINEELKGAISKLEEHDKAKTDFVSNVSHELKTPLASIGYLAGNVLRGIAGEVSEQAKEYMEMIRADCHRLRRTVDDILDMSRIEANTMSLSLSKIPFATFVARTVESMRVQIEAEGLHLQIDLQGSKQFVECDAQKLERVIFNLVKNAMKYNVPSGSILVTVRQDPASQHIIMDVQDTGIGIKKEYLDRVTQRFFRIGEYVSGAGLGLAISKEIVERHGGTLQIQSPPAGQACGTRVSVSIPVVRAPTAFLVYQHDQVRLPVLIQMDSYGYRILAELNSDDVLRRIQELHPDIILLDWITEGMDGGIMLARLKSEEALSRIPLLTIVGAEIDATKKEILDGFAIPLLTFPWQPTDLYLCMENMLMNRKSD